MNVEPEETTILVALAAPNTGVTRVGEVANTLAPVPVSSVSAVKSCSEVKEPNDVAVLTDVIAPVKLGILVVEVAVPLNDVAVIIPLEVTLPTLKLVRVPTEVKDELTTPEPRVVEERTSVLLTL